MEKKSFFKLTLLLHYVILQFLWLNLLSWHCIFGMPKFTQINTDCLISRKRYSWKWWILGQTTLSLYLAFHKMFIAHYNVVVNWYQDIWRCLSIKVFAISILTSPIKTYLDIQHFYLLTTTWYLILHDIFI